MREDTAKEITNQLVKTAIGNRKRSHKQYFLLVNYLLRKFDFISREHEGTNRRAIHQTH